MTYKVIVSKKANKQLKKLDQQITFFIFSYIKKNLYQTDNPRQYGKALINMNHLWSYRVGVYRIIAEIKDHELIILLVNIDHRKSVYQKSGK